MAAAQWERLKTGLGIAEPVPTEPESFPQQLLHQLDEATTLSKTQVCAYGNGSCKQKAEMFHELRCKHVLIQRVYGFAICLGVGLLFGFLVSFNGQQLADILQLATYIADTSIFACSQACSS